MFTLPALLYLKLLPLFGQCLYHLIVPNKPRAPHAGGALPAGPLPALHPFWVGRASVGIFCITPAGGPPCVRLRVRTSHSCTSTIRLFPDLAPCDLIPG
ncbi:hypothetical protein AVEN_212005-1 [Araneus ventricosus]|uniref:Secreted protein n=1 Tax=Araneus ventricosus TaxID=182803 RepID=A0A4Y2SL30_ARAVE|nr:hypothetical protein AVEN_212005-1 [Araneus ventricosus]